MVEPAPSRGQQKGGVIAPLTIFMVHELRIRSNKFVANLPIYIEGVIDDNQELLDLNRHQLKVEHKTIKDQPIKPPYSPAYAELKGFRTPDLYLTGELQRTLKIEATRDGNYYIDGTTDYTGKLIGQYTEDIFGIAISKRAKAKKITTKALAEIYKEVVL